MHTACALLVRAAIANGGLAGNQARLIALTRRFNGFFNRRMVMAVNAHRIPTGRFKATQRIAGFGQVERAVNGNVIIIIEHNEAR